MAGAPAELRRPAALRRLAAVKRLWAVSVARFSGTKREHVAALANAFRGLGLVSAFLGAVPVLAHDHARLMMFGVAIAAASVFYTGVAVVLASGRGVWMLGHRYAPVVDLGFVVVLNVLAAAWVERGRLQFDNVDVFWTAFVGAAGLWAGLNGRRAIVGVLALAAVVQIAMGLVNGIPPADVDLLYVVSRTWWVGLAVIVTCGSLLISARQERLVGDLAARDGQVQALQAMHARTQQELKTIVIVARGDHEDHTAWNRIENIARDLDTYIRCWSEPAAGDREDLTATVRDTVDEFARETTVAFQIVGTIAGPTPADVVDALAFAVGVACQNVVQHSGASRAVIRLGAGPGALVVTVHDNGVGFSSDSVTTSSTGVELLRHAVQRVGGTAELVTAADRGTTWTFSIPTAGRASPPDAGSPVVAP